MTGRLGITVLGLTAALSVGSVLAAAQARAKAGDSCSLNLPSGLKEPGKEDGKGRCCSVFDTTKCQDSKSSSISGGSKSLPPAPAKPTPVRSGDSCSIDLPSGLKEPGKADGKGRCCSIFHADRCQDVKR